MEFAAYVQQMTLRKDLMQQRILSLEKLLTPTKNPGYDAESNADRFEDLDIYKESYKTIGHDKHKISVYLLVPKRLNNGEAHLCPVILSFHGGALVTGSTIYKPHVAVHLVDFAVKFGAIIVAPNYRLMPEHTGHEILDDVDSICNWIKPNLHKLITKRLQYVKVDLSRIMVTGDSAGGYLALYASFKHADTLLPQAVYLRYPMVNAYSLPPGDYMGAEVTEAQAGEEVAEIIDKINELQQAGELPSITEATPPARSWTGIRMAVCGMWERQFGQCERIREEIMIKRAVPRGVWIIHGDKDEMVPIRDTVEFFELLKENTPEVEVEVYTARGEGHGFDHEISLPNINHKEFLGRVLRGWLGSTTSIISPEKDLYS